MEAEQLSYSGASGSTDFIRSAVVDSFQQLVNPPGQKGIRGPSGKVKLLAHPTKKVLEGIIKANELPVTATELGIFLRSDEKPELRDEGVDTRMFGKLFENESLQTQITNRSKYNDLCRIESVGSRMGKGVGIRLTEDLVLTCNHVIEEGDQFVITIPGFVGPDHSLPGDILIHSAMRYQMDKVMCASSSRGKKTEIASWDDVKSLDDGLLDFAVVSIDLGSAQRIIGVRCPPHLVGKMNNFEIATKLPNQQPNIRRPSTGWDSSDAEGQNLELHVLDSNFKVESIPVGTVDKTSDACQRFRYGGDVLAEKGDSGAPVVVSEREGLKPEIVGIHNAKANSLQGQAVPIGPIFREIEKKLHKTELRKLAKENWPVSNPDA